ncbi:MAG: hypothetical protein CAF42_004825 [Nitrospira sp. CG24B]|nr:MAG: hypothetical protein CAF42_004825 [Nitrospira sp. CG24B]
MIQGWRNRHPPNPGAKKPLLINRADGKPGTRKDHFGTKERKPPRHGPIDHHIGIFPSVHGRNRRELAKLMHDVILEVLARLIGSRADPGREVGTPPLKNPTPVLGPAERNQVEAECVAYRGIVLISQPIDGGKPIEGQSSRQRRILIRECRTSPMH